MDSIPRRAARRPSPTAAWAVLLITSLAVLRTRRGLRCMASGQDPSGQRGARRLTRSPSWSRDRRSRLATALKQQHQCAGSNSMLLCQMTRSLSGTFMRKPHHRGGTCLVAAVMVSRFPLRSELQTTNTPQQEQAEPASSELNHLRSNP